MRTKPLLAISLQRVWFLVVLSCLVAPGCGSCSSTTIKPVVATAPAPPPVIDSPSNDNPAPAEPPAEIEPVLPTVEPLPEPKPARERLLLVTPGGALVIEIAITLDGKPFDSTLSSVTREALAAADTDGDGRPTWKEVLASPRFKFGQFGNNPITADMTLKSITEMYDTNRDGLLNAAEAPKFLTKNMAGSNAFSLRATNRIPGDNVIESPVRRWLDEDEDGKLSAAEIAAAPVRLRARDADDDDLLTPADFVAPAAELVPGEMQRRQGRRFGPEAAHLLGAKSKWDNILVALEEQYGADGSSGESFSLTPGLFKQLDTNDSGDLDRKEVAVLGARPPHVSLAVDFGRDPQNKQPHVRLKLETVADELREAVKVIAADDSRLTLSLAGVSLELYGRDASPTVDYDAQAQAVFVMFDADKNGYLEKQELPEENEALVAPFDTLDANGDGKVYPVEIVAQLSRQQAALLGQVQARAGDNEDALFAALDLDADGRLSSREIAGSAKRLKALDVDADGEVSVDEVPGSLVLGLVRADAQAENSPLTSPPPAPRPRPANVPAWFVRMDANEDGELSPQEFLGTLDKFKALDKNADGYLSFAEAQGE